MSRCRWVSLLGLLAAIPMAGRAQGVIPSPLAPYVGDLVVLQSKSDQDAAAVLRQLQERLKDEP